jgi:hypothetical protein
MSKHILVDSNILRLVVAEWLSVCSANGWEPLHLSGHAELAKIVASNGKSRYDSSTEDDYHPYNTVNS